MIRKNRRMTSIWMLVGGLLALPPSAWAGVIDPCCPPPCPTQDIDLVICLDTSGSMTALIDSARARIWDIVSTLSSARPTPRLRVGLLTYGSPSNSTAGEGWIVKHTDLTDDLDLVYARMMAMRTDGGDEFVGWVLNDAVERMSWSPSPKALRIIFVAGNESADQARERYNFRYVAENARARKIIINAIYAGDSAQGENENWPEVARCGQGHFQAIDMRCGTVQIRTPYDDMLNSLNDRLNSTYLPYGMGGRERQQQQVAQDANSAEMGPATMASRAGAKASGLYRNSVWDLVDKSQEQGFSLEELDPSSLPPAMQPLAPAERQAYLEKMVGARLEVQKEIRDVDAKRREFLKDQQKQASGGAVALDEAMLTALRSQAEAAGFRFESAPADASSNGH